MCKSVFTLGNGLSKDNAWNMPGGYTQRFLRLLPMFDLRVVTTSGNWMIVEPTRFGHPKYRKWFLVLDNGGEVIINEINSDALGVKVPYNWFEQTVNAATFTDRVATVIRGQQIDWTFMLSADEESCLLRAVP